MPIVYSFGLTAVTLALVVAEFFLPSGGILMIAAVAAAGSAIFIAYSASGTLAMVVAGTQILTVPILLSAMVRLWPKTAIGRQMLNLPSDRSPPPPPAGSMVGRCGTAATGLMPAGAVLIDGRRIDALSVDGPIDAGQPIRVVNDAGGRIRVCRQLETAAVDETAGPPPSILDLQW